MAKDNFDKAKFVREFEFMKDFEEWAGNFYRQTAANPQIKSEDVRQTFSKIAGDEDRHAEIVQRIINLINNNL
jgi:rubrerythrin